MTPEIELRQAAIERLEARRGFRLHASVYLLVNALLVFIWMTSGQGFFWPIWSIAGWGIGLVGHRLAMGANRPISEDAIRREMTRGY